MVAAESTENELPAGTQVLRRYSVVGKLAQGGMAEVYLARQVGPAGYNKLVVIKRVRPHLASDSDFVGMFVNEARLAAMINHPNVVQIFDLGDEPRPGGGQDWFLAMEYLDGSDMLQVGRACRSHNKAVPFDVTARIIADACAGLDHAHNLRGEGGKQLDLVHRDMSPENILITFEGQVKVVDFGIAKASDNLIKTQAGQIKGKLGYVAPEAILGKPVDARADVFAVGATLYLFLSGRPAFTGSNPMEIFERSLKPPVPPREVNPRVPEPLDAICMKALAQDRNNRYRSAGEVRLALDAYLQSTGRPLGAVQLSQFMRILFPADKDPVRQRIDKLLAEAPMPASLPLTASAQMRGAGAPAPILVDDDKTNIVPPKDQMSVPDPITLQTQKPNLPKTSTLAPQKASGGPAHLRSMGVQKDVASSPSGRPVEHAEMTNEDIDLKTLKASTPSSGDLPPTMQVNKQQALSGALPVTNPGDNAPTLQNQKPKSASPAPSSMEVDLEAMAAAVAEDDELEIDMGAPLPKSTPPVPPPTPTQARKFAGASMDAAAAAFDISISTSADDIGPPPPFEPSGRTQRPANMGMGLAPPAMAPPAPPQPPPPAFSAESFAPPVQAEPPPPPPASFIEPLPMEVSPTDLPVVTGGGSGPGLGIRLAMLGFGGLTGLLILLVILWATGGLARLMGG